MSGLSVSGIVDVNVNVLQAGASVSVGCNKGLIMGDSVVITPEERVKSYRNIAEMKKAGFEDAMPEYLAAVDYFAQKPAPKIVFVGRHDATDTEKIEEAVALCLNKTSEWYGVYVCSASDADILLVAKELDDSNHGILFFETANADSLVAEPSAPDAFTALGTAKRERAIGIYSKTANAGAAFMGLAMGRETGLDNSAFSLTYSSLKGVSVESVDAGELGILMEKNGNIYIVRGQNYQLLHKGRCVDGKPYDDVMYLDMTQNVIEAKVMGVMVGKLAKLPQTDAGMAVVVSAVTEALEKMKGIGYLAEGVWTGEPVKDLQTGDVVPGGYMIFTEPFSTLSASDRALKKSPPITVALKTSGTIESVVINVNVNL